MSKIMAKTPYDSSFSSSKRNFQWTTSVISIHPPLDAQGKQQSEAGEEEKKRERAEKEAQLPPDTSSSSKRKPGPAAKVAAVARIRSLLAAFARGRWHAGLGSRVTVTLFGNRRGHVHFAFQEDPRSDPALLIELATPTGGLVREMATGLLRIALECDKGEAARRLLEEPLWRAYFNGRRRGFAVRRDCTPAVMNILKSVEPISMGAGVLPGSAADGSGELMYMRAKFERVIGSRDSEAFYMMNPEPLAGGPELSVYLLRL